MTGKTIRQYHTDEKADTPQPTTPTELPTVHTTIHKQRIQSGNAYE